MGTVVRIRSMENLTGRIRQHAESLESMQVEIDCLYETVEATTCQAKEKLAQYQSLKRQAAIVLDTVSGGFQDALALFRQSDFLLEKLQKIKIKHDKLSRDVISEAKAHPDGARELICMLKEARQQLRKIYEQVEAMRTESLLAADSQEFEG